MRQRGRETETEIRRDRLEPEKKLLLNHIKVHVNAITYADLVWGYERDRCIGLRLEEQSLYNGSGSGRSSGTLNILLETRDGALQGTALRTTLGRCNVGWDEIRRRVSASESSLSLSVSLSRCLCEIKKTHFLKQ